jgi:hypothetical protein
MTPSNLKYSSGGTGNSPLFGTELEQQQQLRNVLKGKANVAFCVGAGYEFGHLIVDFRYSKSLRDVLETEANSYNFLENTNLTECKQVTLTWYFPLNLK